jgi:hypothetical protein
MMIVPEAANVPPTPWQTEILAPGRDVLRERTTRPLEAPVMAHIIQRRHTQE